MAGDREGRGGSQAVNAKIVLFIYLDTAFYNPSCPQTQWVAEDDLVPLDC